MGVQGFADGRFGLVRHCFAEVVRAQPGTGAAFAAWCDGRLVVDLWGGYADLEQRRRWEAGSLARCPRRSAHNLAGPVARNAGSRGHQNGTGSEW